MYCQKCGQENTDTSKFCMQCGEPLGNVEHSGNVRNISGNSNKVLDYVKNLKKNQICFIVLMILSATGVFLPFAKWVKNPVYQLFSALENYSSYSVFGFFDATNSYGSRSGGLMAFFNAVILLGMIASSVLYVFFIVMAFKKNKKCFLFFLKASVIRLI